MLNCSEVIAQTELSSTPTNKLQQKLRQRHTNPSFNLADQPVPEHLTEGEQQEYNQYERRFLSLESRVSEIATNLAAKRKMQTRRLSWLKPVTVLLSPRNPYDEFHRLFKGVPKEEFPINDYSCALSRDILLHGRLFVSQNWICFYSNIFGFETVVKVECKKVKSISRAKTAYMFPNAILIRTEKKKYLFCSFITRDSAHKRLSNIWQQSVQNNKTDSGVDENANGDGDEGVEEISFDGDQEDEDEISEMTIMQEQLQNSKGHLGSTPLSGMSKHHHCRTMSCPNTPLTHHHPSLEEAIITEHDINEHHHTTTHDITKDKQNHRKTSRLRKYFINGVVKLLLVILNTLYSLVSSLIWLFRRNYCITDFVFLFSTLLLVILLSTTLTLMNRISKLEHRFENTKNGVLDYDQIDDEILSEDWGNVLKEQEIQFRLKTERLNKVLGAIVFSVENVKTKLNLIQDEFVPSRHDVTQQNTLQADNQVCG